MGALPIGKVIIAPQKSNVIQVIWVLRKNSQIFWQIFYFMFNYICQLLYTRWPKSPTPNKYKKDFLFKNKNVIVLGFSWTWNKNPSLVKTGEVQLIHIDGKRRSSSTKRSPYVGVLQHKSLCTYGLFAIQKIHMIQILATRSYALGLSWVCFDSISCFRSDSLTWVLSRAA